MATDLLKPVLSGIKNTYFFEGRLLSGRDLKEQETANRRHREQLGRAIGAGVVKGLEVTHPDFEESDASQVPVPVVNVNKGMAISAKGEVLEIEKECVSIQLSRILEKSEAPDTYFRPCETPSTNVLPNGEGLYLLVMSPAAEFEGYAPKSGLDTEGVSYDCGRRYLVEGVRFRLEQIPIDQYPEIKTRRDALKALPSGASAIEKAKAVSLLRNAAAHVCLRSAASSGHGARIRKDETQAFDPGRDLIRALVENEKLTDCDVPLALLFWDLEGMRFVDNWSVRRLVRWYPDRDLISLFPVHGLERLLQFADQLHYYLSHVSQPGQQPIESLFRYLPPMGYYPATGVGSPGGFHPSTFTGSFSNSITGRLTVAMFSDLLDQSFRHASIDLQEKPYLQVFDLPQNSSAVQSGNASQRYRVFMTREINGPHTVDGVAKAFEDAWDVYRGILTKRVFLPAATDEEKITSLITITTAVRDVMDMANRLVALAAGSTLDKQAALEAFTRLHAVQNDLSKLLQSDIPGVTDTQNRKTFGAALDRRLNAPQIDNDKPGLDPAIQSENLVAVVDAQNSINTFVGSWTGEGVAVGPFGVTYSRSPQGTDLVPGASAIPHIFTLFNGTDKTLTINLEAEISGATGVWNTPRILAEQNGPEIDSATLVSGARREFVAMVAAPEDAVTGQSPTLKLTAGVAPPTDKSLPFEFKDLLNVSDTGGAPVEGMVRIQTHQFNPNDIDGSDLEPGTHFRVFIGVNYSDTVSRDFDLEILVTSDTMDEWQFIADATGQPLESTDVSSTRRRYRLPVDSLSPGEPMRVLRVRIDPPVSRTDTDKSALLTLTIRSVDTLGELTHDYGGQTIQLMVKSQDG